MGGPKEDETKRAEAWTRVVEELKRALEYAGNHDVRLAVDGVWKDWLTETPEDFLRLHSEVDHPLFGINFDPCYLTLLGLDPAEVAHQWGNRIVHAHLKDHVGSYPDWKHRIPGQGDVNYARVIHALREIGFQEALSVETFTDMGFDESCERGHAALAPLLATDPGH